MRNAAKLEDKVKSLRDAVSLIEDGCILGVGGFTLSRSQVAIAHEIIRQGKKDLTVVGASVSLQMDLLVGAGCVRRIEHGAASIERFGRTYNLRRALQEGKLEIEDYTHLGMASRFLAGELGIPFMPIKGYLGTDLMRAHPRTRKKLAVIDDPFSDGNKVVLLPACVPDVAILHVQKADPLGNVVIDGCTFNDVELARAARKVIVTTEELVSSDAIRRDPERTSIPGIYVDAVVVQPWGAYPTSCYGYYDYDREHLSCYQEMAQNADTMRSYLDQYVYSVNTFDEFLDKTLTFKRSRELEESMKAMVYGG